MQNNEFEEIIELNIADKGIGERIDKYLSDMLSSYSRSYIQKLISDGMVLVNHKNIKSNYRLDEDDLLKIMIPLPKELEILPEDIPLDIVYEDDDVILVNKPKGMVVHPANGH